MPSLKNSYPKRAYRRKQRALKARRRLALTHRTYDSGYTYYEKEDGTVYVVRRAYYRNLKRECKQQTRRKTRRAKFNAYGQYANYRKYDNLWWNIY